MDPRVPRSGLLRGHEEGPARGRTTAVRVLHVSEVSWGGVVSLIRQFSAQQAARGHEVHLLVPPDFPDMEHGIRRSWSVQRHRWWGYPRAVRELRAAIRELQPDVVHLHSFMAGFLGRLPMVLGTRQVAIVYQPHAWSFDLRGSRTFRIALQAWENFAARRTQVLAANCQDEIAEGRAAGVRTYGQVVGVAIDTVAFHPVDRTTQVTCRAALGIGTENVLLCLGRVARQKGQDLLVAAWEADPIPDTTLVFVGPGDTRPLQELAPKEWNSSIRAVGEDSDVRRWLWASDVLVLPSRYETVAVVVAEAMACSRPVVATAVNGVPEVLVEGAHPPAGRVVGVGDMTGLLDGCRQILAEPEKSVAMGEAGRARALELFGADVIGDRLDLAYNHALSLVAANRT